jgi:hypothetical protein
MSVSASAYLIAGVPLGEVLSVRHEKHKRTVYDRNTGVPSEVEYRQTIYSIEGTDIPIGDELARPGYDDHDDAVMEHDAEHGFRVWLKAIGMPIEDEDCGIVYFDEYSKPQILGHLGTLITIAVGDECEVSAAAIDTAMISAADVLKAAGINTVPRLFLVSRLE